MDTPEDFFARLDEHFISSMERYERERRRKRFISVFDKHSKRFTLATKQIWWITVEDEIAEFHAPNFGDRFLHRKGSLQTIARQLDNGDFFRANKNTLINARYVVAVEWDHHEIILENGTTIHFTPTYYEEVKAALPHLL